MENLPGQTSDKVDPLCFVFFLIKRLKERHEQQSGSLERVKVEKTSNPGQEWILFLEILRVPINASTCQ